MEIRSSSEDSQFIMFRNRSRLPERRSIPFDAKLEERSARRAADGVHENIAARDQRDSQRAAAPLMIALGAKVLDNSKMTSAETSGWLLAEIHRLMALPK